MFAEWLAYWNLALKGMLKQFLCEFTIVLLAVMFCQQSVAIGLHNKQLTLSDSVMLAIRDNSNIETAKLQRVIDKYNLELAEYDFQPQYHLTGSLNRQMTPQGNDTNTQTQFTTTLLTPVGTQLQTSLNDESTNGSHQPTVNLSLTQPLLRGFGKEVVQANLMNAHDQETINKLSLRNTVITTITNVILAYRQLVEDKQQLSIQALAVKGFENTIRINQALIKAGRMAPSELIQAKSQLASARVSRDQAENRLEQDSLSFLDQLGLEPSTQVRIVDDIEFEQAPQFDKNRSILQALENDENYQSQLLNREIAKRQLNVDQNNQHWQLNAVASHTEDLRHHGSESTDSTNLGLQLEIPIDDFPREQAVVNDRTRLAQSNISIRDSRHKVVETVLSDLANLRILYKQALNSIEARKLQEQTYQQTMIKLRYGRTTNFELLSQQDELNRARVSEVNSKISYLNALTNFRDTIGVTLDYWDIRIRY